MRYIEKTETGFLFKNELGRYNLSWRLTHFTGHSPHYAIPTPGMLKKAREIMLAIHGDKAKKLSIEYGIRVKPATYEQLKEYPSDYFF